MILTKGQVTVNMFDMSCVFDAVPSKPWFHFEQSVVLEDEHLQVPTLHQSQPRLQRYLVFCAMKTEWRVGEYLARVLGIPLRYRTTPSGRLAHAFRRY